MSKFPRLEEFKKRLKDLAEAKGTQDFIATECGLHVTQVSKFFSSNNTFVLHGFGLANLARLVGEDVASTLAIAEYYWLKAKLDEEPPVPPPRKDETVEQTTERHKAEGLRREVDARLEIASRPIGTRAKPRLTRGLLSNWRDWLSPVTVFVGDRRDTSPKTPGDLLALPAAMGDLQFLPSLQLPADAEIRSDKTITVSDRETLRELVEDRNLLILGSPAANLVAREANAGASFSFHNAPEAVKYEARIRAMFDHLSLEQLEQLMTPSGPIPQELEELARWRNNMLSGFAQQGILDPVNYASLRGTSRDESVDYGLISLAKHPWSEHRVAIIAAGIGGAGTAAAVQKLSEPGSFDMHPLGGVIRVIKDPRLGWAKRYSNLKTKWDTHDYSLLKYEMDLKSFVDDRRGSSPGIPEFWDPDRVLALLAMLKTHAPA